MARVLIIEDNPANMKLACLLLRHAGHSVLCAVDTETGLTAARTERPSLVLMDMQLPGMDGLTATALLKQDPLTAAIPVIALTALAMKADQEKCLAAGCDGYIAKPLRYQELFTAINALLDDETRGEEGVSQDNEVPLRAVSASSPHATDGAIRITAGTAHTDERMILVAEDNEINQKLILRQLALLGYAANVAGNGQLALERWLTGHYALLLTDLRMPEMNGYALTLAIRAREHAGARMPIVALTANLCDGETEECARVGIDACLGKPLQLADLKAMLDTWLPRTGVMPHTPETGRITEAGSEVVDVRVLERAIGNDPAVVRGFLAEFERTASVIAGALVGACNAGQAQQASDEAHKLMSSARAIGARALGAVCAKIESAGRSGNTELTAALVPMFEQEFDAEGAFLAAARMTSDARPEADHRSNSDDSFQSAHPAA